MSVRNRTFVLQAVGVAVVVGVIFFAFLRSSGQDELAGIDAPGSEGPTLTIPGDNRNPGKDRDHGSRSGKGARNRTESGRNSIVRSVFAAPVGGQTTPPAGHDPADDQYMDTATALMDKVRAAPGGFAR